MPVDINNDQHVAERLALNSLRIQQNGFIEFDEASNGPRIHTLAGINLDVIPKGAGVLMVNGIPVLLFLVGTFTDRAIATYDTTNNRLRDNPNCTIASDGTPTMGPTAGGDFIQGVSGVDTDIRGVDTERLGIGSLTRACRQVISKIAQVRAGASSGYIAKVGGVIFDHFTDGGNVTTGETDLFTDTLPASILNANGEKIEAHYAGIYAGAATATQQVKVYFGGTVIFDTGALAIGAVTNYWDCWIEIIRVDANTVRCSVSYTSNFGTLVAASKYTSVGSLTLTNTQVMKVTGTAAGVGAASNQIIAKESHAKWLPAA